MGHNVWRSSISTFGRATLRPFRGLRWSFPSWLCSGEWPILGQALQVVSGLRIFDDTASTAASRSGFLRIEETGKLYFPKHQPRQFLCCRNSKVRGCLSSSATLVSFHHIPRTNCVKSRNGFQNQICQQNPIPEARKHLSSSSS